MDSQVRDILGSGAVGERAVDRGGDVLDPLVLDQHAGSSRVLNISMMSSS